MQSDKTNEKNGCAPIKHVTQKLECECELVNMRFHKMQGNIMFSYPLNNVYQIETSTKN